MQQMFEPGRTRLRSFTDFAEFAKSGPDGLIQEVYQISGGRASASHASVELPSLRLDVVSWNQGFLSQGEAQSGVVVIGGADCGPPLPRFQGRPVGRSDLPFLPGGAAFEFLAEAPGQMLLMTVEQQAFTRHARAIWGGDLPNANGGYTIPLAREADADRLRQQFRGFFAALSGQAAALGVPGVAALAEDQLLSAMLTATTPPPVRVLPAYRHNAARAAVQHLRSRCDGPVTLRELCEAVGASFRTIELGFRELYGVGPSAYLRIVRLHGARRTLCAADPAAATVTGVATRWGFFHFGRFSVEYRRLFGEPPSDTLWKRHPLS